MPLPRIPSARRAPPRTSAPRRAYPQYVGSVGSHPACGRDYRTRRRRLLIYKASRLFAASASCTRGIALETMERLRYLKSYYVSKRLNYVVLSLFGQGLHGIRGRTCAEHQTRKRNHSHGSEMDTSRWRDSTLQNAEIAPSSISSMRPASPLSSGVPPMRLDQLHDLLVQASVHQRFVGSKSRHQRLRGFKPPPQTLSHPSLDGLHDFIR